jgi:AcrR family transcriptional regulator
MPKISAATVVEHRTRQRHALLQGARAIVLDGGYAALTFTALAERTGLARPTLYSYFATRDDVVIALCESELPLIAAEIRSATRHASTPRAGLEAYVRVQLRAARQCPDRLAHALVNAPLPDDTRRRILALHDEVIPSAAPLLKRLGHPDPELAALLVQGLVNAAVTAIDAGRPYRRVARATIDAALHGLGSSPSRTAAAPGGTSPPGPGQDGER